MFLSSLLANGIGTVIGWSMSGFIIEHFGWHYAFYAVVIILGIFTVVWFLIVYDSPSNHPKITQSEREYIVSKLKKTNTTEQQRKVIFVHSVLLSGTDC